MGLLQAACVARVLQSTAAVGVLQAAAAGVLQLRSDGGLLQKSRPDVDVLSMSDL